MRTEHRDDMLSDVCHRASLPSNAAPCMLGSLTLATCVVSLSRCDGNLLTY